MPTPHLQRDPRRDAATATRSSLTGPPSAGAILGSFATFIDHLVAAQTQLISSYLRLGSSVARRSDPATPAATTRHTRRHDDEPAPAGAHREPAPAPGTDSIEARAYEIFVQRGREPGNPVDDWQRAEAELQTKMTG
jgi:Protein of unknown function (DUF2934)